MEEYWVTLIGVALLSGFSELLIPGESKLLPAMRFLGGLCVICVALSPISSLLFELKNNNGDSFLNLFSYEAEEIDYEEKYKESYLSFQGREAEKSIKERLCSHLSLSAEGVDVRVRFQEGELAYEVDTVYVILRGQEVFADPARITSAVKEMVDAPCRIVYE